MRGTGECVHSGTPTQSLSALTLKAETDLWAGVAEAGWWSRRACICTERESGGRMDDGWGSNTLVQSDGLVMGGGLAMGGGLVMGGGRVRGNGQGRSASRLRVHGYWVGDP